jgi:cell division protein FtsA
MVICALERGKLRFLGSASAQSHGGQKGRTADQTAVADSIRAAPRDAEAAAQVSVEGVVVGMGGYDVRGANGRGAIELGPVRVIDQRDVKRVVDRASHVQLHEDRMVLQMFPQDFVVDDHPGHRDPRNMMASRLEINVHLVTASVLEHTALVGAVNQAHLLCEETVFEALAGCYATVLPEFRQEGIAVVDIGAHSTELVVYYGDAMCLASTVKISGDHFTRDLAQDLRINFDDAELTKKEFGGAVAGHCPDNIVVELPSPDERSAPRQAQRRFLNQVLEARATELFRYVKAELSRVGMEASLMGGVFLTGGGAKLPDLCDIAERELECQARYGLTIGIQDWPDQLDDPEWSVAAGLAMYSAKMKSHLEQQREAAGWIGKILK